MIGWKCDLYAYKNYSIKSIDNLSKAILVDKNRFFVIPFSNVNDNVNAFYKDFSTAYAILENRLGQDINVLYRTPAYTVGKPINSYNNLLKWFPSIPLGFPNSFKEYLEGGYTFYIYIKTLNKVIGCNNYDTSSPQGTCEIGNVANDFSVTWITDSKYNNRLFAYALNMRSSSTSTFTLTTILGYNDDTNLQDVNIWTHGYVSVQSDGGGTLYLYKAVGDSAIQRTLSALFDTGHEKPDFKIIPPDNPYGPGGDSSEGGGGGSFDDDSDIIGIPSLPTLSSANTGFTRIYNPSLSQVQDLARYLWTDDSVIETIWNHIKQFFENPMDAIIGFNLVPVVVPNGGTENFKLMYIDTGVSMTVAANQFVDVDCGTLEIKQYYGSALDYSPYTKISCFLPFIGNVSLNVDEVMGRTLQVKYRVDICSGSCVAYILVDGNAIYQYSGHCAIPIPLASADFSSYVNAAISVAKLAGAALTAGAAALAGQTAENAAQQTNQIVSTTQQVTTARNPATGRQITTGTVTTTTTRDLPSKEQSSTEASFAGITAQNVSNTVGAIMSSKPHIEHSGSFSGNSGYLGVRRPFIIIERPNMCMPANYQALNGFPCMITLELGSCKGFTRVQQVQLTGLHATNPEQAEILQLLKSGVIL